MEHAKIIWMYWHQGFEQAPEIVSRCVEQWIEMHEAGQDWFGRNASVHGSFNLTKKIVEGLEQ